MTNLAEGFMLISEQEKSGKVERRKDMQTMTSAYANKMLKSLEEDKAFWVNKEAASSTYVAAHMLRQLMRSQLFLIMIMSRSQRQLLR